MSKVTVALAWMLTLGFLGLQNSQAQNDPIKARANFKYIQNLTLKRCDGCHKGSFADLPTMQKFGMVSPGHPEKSGLYTSTASNRMPLHGPPLETLDKEAIKLWISLLPPTP